MIRIEVDVADVLELFTRTKVLKDREMRFDKTEADHHCSIKISTNSYVYIVDVNREEAVFILKISWWDRRNSCEYLIGFCYCNDFCCEKEQG